MNYNIRLLHETTSDIDNMKKSSKNKWLAVYKIAVLIVTVVIAIKEIKELTEDEK